MPKNLISTLTRGCAAAALAVVAASSAHAQLVVRDAQTGELRAPTAEEAAALGAKASTSRAGGAAAATPSPQAKHLPSGEIALEHDQSMLNYSVVTRRSDGKLSQRCVTSAQVAQLMAEGKRTSFAKNILEIANER